VADVTNVGRPEAFLHPISMIPKILKGQSGAGLNFT